MTRLKSKLLAIPAIGRRSAALCALVAVFACAPGFIAGVGGAQESPALSPQREAALKAFLQRVNGYLELRSQLQKDLSKPKTGDRGTGKAEAQQDTLATRLQIARKGVQPGTVFGDAGPYFKRIIQRDIETRGIRDAFATMEEVPAQSAPAVNATYPEKLALATVPPLILVNLPRLPDGLEYRFMGRDLILRDRDANIIVDFLPGAVPVLKP
jgi:hypothetical protein